MGRAIPTGLENSLFRPECVITETMGRGVGKEQERGGEKGREWGICCQSFVKFTGQVVSCLNHLSHFLGRVLLSASSLALNS